MYLERKTTSVGEDKVFVYTRKPKTMQQLMEAYSQGQYVVPQSPIATFTPMQASELHKDLTKFILEGGLADRST